MSSHTQASSLQLDAEQLYVGLLAGVRRLIQHVSVLPRDDGPASATPPYTLSIGVAQFLKGDSPTDLVRRTDAATYEAKRQGKNRAVGDACL